MRIVGKFQFACDHREAIALDKVVAVIDDWSQDKFSTDNDGQNIIRRSGAKALYDQSEEYYGNDTLVKVYIIETVPDGELNTTIQIFSTPSHLHFQCKLALQSESGLTAPRVSVKPPRFITKIIELDLEWYVGSYGERIFSQVFNVQRDDVDELINSLDANQRRLPVILFSELYGATLAGDIQQRASADNCGLAHTCRLTNEASWELTNRLGKEWSCYNGAVRLFWPLRGRRDDFRRHPLWTYDSLMNRAENEHVARDRFRQQLTEQLLEASTFVADDPVFLRLEGEKVRPVSDEQRQAAAESGDFEKLAEEYARENSELRTDLERSRIEIVTLSQNIEALTIALRSGQTTSTADADTQVAPESVIEAVRIAQDTLTSSLGFSDTIDDNLRSLNPTAGPPEKLLRYLRTLASLSHALDGDSSLGRSVPIWLKERNIDCSIESETIRNNPSTRQRRTFNVGGTDFYCDYHAKPADAVSPDRCVRIYFALADLRPRVRIGYIGRHFE